MTEILLFNPSAGDIYGKMKGPGFPPVGLVMLATVLKEDGFSVRVVDMNLGNVNNQFLDRYLDNCFLCGISITTPTMKSGLKLAEMLKRHRPDIKIVLGGVHVTLKPEDAFKCSAVDYAVTGEGEYVLRDLARSLKNGHEPGELPGLWERNHDGSVKKGLPHRFIEDIDELATPDFTVIENNVYSYPDALTGPVLPLVTSRGCPGKCSFCSSLALWGRRLRMRSAEKVVEDFQLLVEKYGVREVHIWDDNFVTSRQRVRDIARLMEEKNIEIKIAFPNGVRVDFLDEEIVALLKAMGTYSVAVGVESGNQETLNQMNKMITLDKIENAVSILKKYNLETWAFILFGMPDETEEMIKQTIDFTIKLNPNVAKFHILMPYPGTQITGVLLERGLILNKKYEEYGIHLDPVHRTESLSPHRLMELREIAYRRFYFRASKMLSESLRMIRSWHRLKLNFPLALKFVIFKLLDIGKK